MISLSLEKELKAAFERLDHERIVELAGHVDAKQQLNDYQRIVLAFGALSTGEPAKAEEWLGGLTGDGSASLGDLAYVRAFRRELNGDLEGMAEALLPHLEDPRATHGGAMRLRCADAFLKLRKFDQLPTVLGPVLEPPGTNETLEAHLIMLEGMLLHGTEKERLIEQLSMIDGLIEKGFRLSTAENAIYYAGLMDRNKLEPVVGPLLNAHEGLLERHKAADRDEIVFLLLGGEKHKVPAAVRAAGRAFAAEPFPWEEVAPERAAYLFSTHEEHEAARQSILMGYPKSRIAKDQDLWGPLILSTYHSGKWRETLELLRDHRQEIAQLPMAANAQMVRALCEFHIGRHSESLQTMEALGDRLFDEASGHEAAVRILVLIPLNRTGEIVPVAERIFALKKDDSEWINEFATAVLTQIVLAENVDALNRWIEVLDGILRPEIAAPTLQRVGEMSVDWAMPEGGRTAAGLLEKRGENLRAMLLRAFAATEEGDSDTALRELQFASPIAKDGGAGELLLMRARCLRRLQDRETALSDANDYLQLEEQPRRHAVLAIKEGLYREMNRPQEALQAREEAMSFIRTKSDNRDLSTMMLFEVNQLARGESGEAFLAMAKEVQQREPGSVEVLRLARKAAKSPDRSAEVEQEAREISEAWRRKYLEPAR